MSELENEKILYVLEQMAYNDFLKKGTKALDDIDLIVVHALLARCEHAMDRQHNLIRQVEHELLFRLTRRIIDEKYMVEGVPSTEN